MMHISTNIANIEIGPSNIETSPSKAINGRSTTHKADRTSEAAAARSPGRLNPPGVRPPGAVHPVDLAMSPNFRQIAGT